MKKFFIGILSMALSNSVFAGIPVIPTAPNIADWNLAFISNTSQNPMTIHYGICAYNPADTRIKAYICPMPFSEVKLPAKKYAPVLIPKDKLDDHGKLLTHYTIRIFDVTSAKAKREESDAICEIDLAKDQNGIILKEDAKTSKRSKVLCNLWKWSFAKSN